MTKDFYLMTSAEVCKIFEIKPSTLRKWAVLLKNAGHEFHQDEHGRRHYRDSDVAIFHRFVALKERSDMSLDEAAKEVIREFKRENIDDYGADDIAGSAMELIRYDERYLPAIKNFLDSQQKQTIEYLEEREKRSEERERRLQASHDEMVKILLERFDEREKEWAQRFDALEAQNKHLIEMQTPVEEKLAEDSADIAEEVADSTPTKRSWWDRLTGK